MQHEMVLYLSEVDKRMGWSVEKGIIFLKTWFMLWTINCNIKGHKTAAARVALLKDEIKQY